MHRMRLLGAMTALALVGGGAGATAVAQAKPTESQGEGAALLRSECNISIEGFVGLCTFQTVLTPSGNAATTGRGTLDTVFGAEAPERPVRITGFPCVTFLGSTFDSRLTVTPSGRFHFICKVKHPKREQPE